MAEPIQLTMLEFMRMSATDRISVRRFGQRTLPVETDVTLAAATVAKILGGDADRISWTVSNTGTTNPASLSNLEGVIQATGSMIGPGGGGAGRDALEDGSVVGREVFAISTAGTTLHIVQSRVYGDVFILPPGVTAL